MTTTHSKQRFDGPKGRRFAWTSVTVLFLIMTVYGLTYFRELRSKNVGPVEPDTIQFVFVPWYLEFAHACDRTVRPAYWGD